MCTQATPSGTIIKRDPLFERQLEGTQEGFWRQTEWGKGCLKNDLILFDRQLKQTASVFCPLLFCVMNTPL